MMRFKIVQAATAAMWAALLASSAPAAFQNDASLPAAPPAGASPAVPPEQVADAMARELRQALPMDLGSGSVIFSTAAEGVTLILGVRLPAQTTAADWEAQAPKVSEAFCQGGSSAMLTGGLRLRIDAAQPDGAPLPPVSIDHC